MATDPATAVLAVVASGSTRLMSVLRDLTTASILRHVTPVSPSTRCAEVNSSAAASALARRRSDAPPGPPRFTFAFDHLMVVSLHPHHHPGKSRDDRHANDKHKEGRHNTPPSLRCLGERYAGVRPAV